MAGSPVKSPILLRAPMYYSLGYSGRVFAGRAHQPVRAFFHG